MGTPVPHKHTEHQLHKEVDRRGGHSHTKVPDRLNLGAGGELAPHVLDLARPIHHDESWKEANNKGYQQVVVDEPEEVEHGPEGQVVREANEVVDLPQVGIHEQESPCGLAEFLFIFKVGFRFAPGAAGLPLCGARVTALAHLRCA